MRDLDRRRWLLRAAWVPFILGAVLVLVELIQRFSDIHWLDSPWSGAVGLWLMAFLMTTLANRPVPPP